MISSSTSSNETDTRGDFLLLIMIIDAINARITSTIIVMAIDVGNELLLLRVGVVDWNLVVVV